MNWIEFFFDQFNSTEFNSTEVSLSIAVLLVNYNGNVNTESYSTEHVVSKKSQIGIPTSRIWCEWEKKIKETIGKDWIVM